MFDISWTEFLLIGVVALIVIGPKELPAVLRTLGQWTRKVRSMAADFQNQFQEAMREAEMADLKKDVDDMAKDFSTFDPLKDVRDSVETMGKDLEKSIEAPPKSAEPAEPALDGGMAAAPALTETTADAPAAIAATPESAPAAATAATETERTG
jgi:sec-independent protein translocase protein TatB